MSFAHALTRRLLACPGKKTAIVGSLDPYVAYRFRVTASNAVGTSGHGPESSPALTDAEHAKVGEAPTVVSTSSASITSSGFSEPGTFPRGPAPREGVPGEEHPGASSWRRSSDVTVPGLWSRRISAR